MSLLDTTASGVLAVTDYFPHRYTRVPRVQVLDEFGEPVLDAYRNLLFDFLDPTPDLQCRYRPLVRGLGPDDAGRVIVEGPILLTPMNVPADEVLAVGDRVRDILSQDGDVLIAGDAVVDLVPTSAPDGSMPWRIAVLRQAVPVQL